MSNQKVLIVSYYWPPSGGSGVQRWLKFVKYLPEFGWKPYVFTPENPSVPIKDASLLRDVPEEAVIVKIPIWEPYELFGKLSGIFTRSKGNSVQADLVNTERTSLFSRFSIYVRGNILIPDPRKFWVRPAVRFLEDYLERNEIKTIITTGPPHSMHLIGLALKKKNSSLKWIVDMRDPWSEWGFLDSIKAGQRAKAKHRKLEHQVLTTADEVITITPFYVKQFGKLSGRKVNLVTNGFDEDDFRKFTLRKSDKFTLRHAGIVNEKCNPRPFMTAVAELCLENEAIGSDIEIEFIGQVDPAFKEFVRQNDSIKAITKFRPPVGHDELITIYGTSAVLVLILTGYKDAEGYMPGKLFEYLATGLPILATGPEDGDAANLLTSTQSGVMINASDPDRIKATLIKYYNAWKNSSVNQVNGNTAYSRKDNTRALTNLLG